MAFRPMAGPRAGTWIALDWSEKEQYNVTGLQMGDVDKSRAEVPIGCPNLRNAVTFLCDYDPSKGEYNSVSRALIVIIEMTSDAILDFICHSNTFHGGRNLTDDLVKLENNFASECKGFTGRSILEREGNTGPMNQDHFGRIQTLLQIEDVTYSFRLEPEPEPEPGRGRGGAGGRGRWHGPVPGAGQGVRFKILKGQNREDFAQRLVGDGLPPQ